MNEVAQKLFSVESKVAEEKGDLPEGQRAQARWIGNLEYLEK